MKNLKNLFFIPICMFNFPNEIIVIKEGISLDGREFEIRQDLDGSRIQLLRGNLFPGIYLLKAFDDKPLINQQKLIIW